MRGNRFSDNPTPSLRTPYEAVVPRACGVPSMPRPFGSIIGVSGILDHPNIQYRHCERSEAIHSLFFCGTMDCFASLAMTADMDSHSRGMMRPRFASIFAASEKSEGAGNAGCALHPTFRAQWLYGL